MRLIGIVSGYACLLLSILIVAEILGRKLLNVSIQGVDEIGGYVVAITGTFGMALATWHRAHTRIDILLTRVAVVPRAVLSTIAYLSLAAGAVFMSAMAWRTLAETIEFGSVSSTPLQTPLWIPQSLWLAGLISFSLTAIGMCLRGLWLFRRGTAETDRFLAATSIREEIDEARHD